MRRHTARGVPMGAVVVLAGTVAADPVRRRMPSG